MPYWLFFGLMASTVIAIASWNKMRKEDQEKFKQDFFGADRIEELRLPWLKPDGRNRNYVKLWQNMLDLKPDGKFGPKTRRKTALFQRHCGMKPTGFVDKETWKKGLVKLTK